MNPQFDLVMSLLNVPKYAPHAWPHLTQRSRAATGPLGCFASTRAGEIVQILVCHLAFYEKYDTSEEGCSLNCGLISMRQKGTGKGEEGKMVQKLVFASTSLLPHESFD
jgi:hypothetical protein